MATIYLRPYFGVAEQEIRLASIGDRDIVVNIGCGTLGLPGD
jgi:hypothetical protein